MEKYCEHLQQAEEAKANNVKADEFQVKNTKLDSLNLDECDLRKLKAASKDGCVTTFILPGSNLAVPSLVERSHDNPLEFLHLKNLKCPLQKCKEKKSKLHTLMKKDGPICLHSLLGHCTQSSEPESVMGSKPDKAKPIPKVDRDLTVRYVHDQIKEHFPTMTSKGVSQFLVKNSLYIKSLVLKQNISEEINSQVPSMCKFCENSKLVTWPYGAKKSYFLSMGHFQELSLKIKTCKLCKMAYYPELYSEGLLPVHNKFILSFDIIMDFYNLLVTGSSLIENIEAKFLLLGKCNGFEEDALRVNLSNHGKNIEKCVIAATSSLSEP